MSDARIENGFASSRVRGATDAYPQREVVLADPQLYALDDPDRPGHEDILSP